MALLSRADGLRIVGPHFAGIFDAIDDSWSTYMSDYTPEQRATHCTTTRAGIVHDIMVARASAYFTSIPNSSVTDLSGLKLFSITSPEGQIVIRFKKFDDQLLSRNQRTKQVADYRGQRQMDLIGEAFHLEAGYILDKDQLKIEQISLVCPNNEGNYWDIQLTRTTAETKVHDIFDVEHADEKVDIVRPKPQTAITGKSSINEGKDK